MKQLIAKGRWQQSRGKLRKIWGKLTRNPCAEFLGEQEIMQGKLREFHARSGNSRDAPFTALSEFGYSRHHRDLVT